MSDTTSHTTISAPQSEGRRYDIYALIHKGIRRFMFDTLNKVGSADYDDADDVAAVLAQVRLLADFCLGHLEHENHFVHAAMEARRPGSAADLAEEHEHHRWAIGQLNALAAAAEQAGGSARETAMRQLYRFLSVFIGENLVHMNVEEAEHNAVLWATHTDAELMGIEQALVASLAPHEAMVSMQWMIPAMHPQERAEKLGGIQRHAPAPVFGALLGIAEETLSPPELEKLRAALALPEPLAA